MKKLIAGIIIGFVLTASTTAFAKDIKQYVLTKFAYPILVDGKAYENSQLPALNYNGNTYLPLKDVGKVLGTEVKWNEKLKRVEVAGLQEQSIPTPTPLPRPIFIPTPSIAPTPEPTLEPTPTPTIQPTPSPDNSLIRLTAEMEGHKVAVQDINDSYTRYKNVVADKIEQITRQNPVGTWDDYQYSQELTTLENQRLALQNRINSMALDNSPEGKSKVLELKRNLKLLDDQWDLMMLKRSSQVQIRALEDGLKTETQNYRNKLADEDATHASNMNGIN